MLRDKYPEIYENESVLTTYCNRIIHNYGIDIALLRGVPLGFDCDVDETDYEDEWKTKIKRTKNLRRATTLELIFTQDESK